MVGMAEEQADNAREESFAARLASARAKAAKLAATRAAIFREELAEKGTHAAWGIAGFVIAFFFLSLALLVATALVAALFAKLFGSAILGVTATLVLYLVIAAAGALLGVRAMQKVEPSRFPATEDAIRGDLAALSAAASPPSAPQPDDGGEDFESRFRAGSE
jgi:Flp pilus assembly protein TadB